MGSKESSYLRRVNGLEITERSKVEIKEYVLKKVG
jgi:hypothetical protein